MNIPETLRYSKSHEWLLDMGNGIYRIGLTDFAQDSLGDIVFVDLPEVGDTVTAGDSFGDVESVKAVSEMDSPVDGVVKAVNEDLGDSPEKINEDPYGAWIIEVEQVSGTVELLDAKEYQQICENE